MRDQSDLYQIVFGFRSVHYYGRKMLQGRKCVIGLRAAEDDEDDGDSIGGVMQIIPTGRPLFPSPTTINDEYLYELGQITATDCPRNFLIDYLAYGLAIL